MVANLLQNVEKSYGNGEKLLDSSKVVDENGEPLVVYHGTRWEMMSEEPGKAVFNLNLLGSTSGDLGFYGKGFYFTIGKEESSFYGKPYQFFLNLKKPFDFNSLTEINGEESGSGIDYQTEIYNLGKMFPDLFSDVDIQAVNEIGEDVTIRLSDYCKMMDTALSFDFDVQESKEKPGHSDIRHGEKKHISVDNNGEQYEWSRYDYEQTWWRKPNTIKKAEIAYDYLREVGIDGIRILGLPYLPEIIQNHDFIGEIKKIGYDGVKSGTEFVAVEPTQIKSATDNVGTFDGGNGDIRYQFVGERGAANADRAEEATVRLDNLAVAREMETSGKDAKAIKMATGWERGADGKWRYEVMDGKFSYKGDLHPERYELTPDEKKFEKEIFKEEMDAFEKGALNYPYEITEDTDMVDIYVAGGMDRAKAERIVAIDNKKKALREQEKHLDDYLDNEELFNAYPELREIKISTKGGNNVFVGKLGSYNPETNTIHFYDVADDTLLHEVQHAIQRIEGFARGGNPQAVEELFNKAHEEWKARRWAEQLQVTAKENSGKYDTQKEVEDILLKEYHDMGLDEMIPSRKVRLKGFNYFVRGYYDVSFDDAIKQFRLDSNGGVNFDSNKGYRRLAGEVEARNVQKRIDMSMEERRATLASETEDVAREDQIFIKSAFGESELSRRGEKANNTDDGTLFESEDTKNKIEDLFNQSISGGLKGKPISIGRLTDAGKSYLERISGIRLKDKVDFVLNPSDLVHIYKEHFGNNEKDKGQNIPLNIEDIRGIVDVISNPDKIIFFNEATGNNRKMFYFFKDAKDGTYNLMEIYSDGKGNLTAKTLYKTRKDATQRVMDIEKSLLPTSETYSGAILSDAKIPRIFDNAIVEEVKNSNSQNGTLFESEDTMYRVRTDEPPTKTGTGYKVFVLKNGKLYPPMVANPGGDATPVGIWLDADAAPIAGQSKTGRDQVKAGGKGTQGGSGSLAYRPGWHLGEIPYALQFNRKDENGEKTLFPGNFVWAEVEYADDVDYQKEAMQYGYTEKGKFRHSYAGLPRLPINGAYRYRTNPNPETDPWIITGAMRVKRVLTPSEVDEMVKAAGRKPQQREAFLPVMKMAFHEQNPTVSLPFLITKVQQILKSTMKMSKITMQLKI
ncbi:MAG: LPD23 domain-containing protein [Muribaculaceae bacterium]